MRKHDPSLIAINRADGHISGNVMTAEDYSAEMFVAIPYDKFACIDLVIVPVKCRRRGKGSRLVREFGARAKEAGAKALLAELVPFADAVTVEARQAFFKKLGFKIFPVNEEEHDIPPLLMIAKI